VKCLENKRSKSHKLARRCGDCRHVAVEPKDKWPYICMKNDGSWPHCWEPKGALRVTDEERRPDACELVSRGAYGGMWPGASLSSGCTLSPGSEMSRESEMTCVHKSLGGCQPKVLCGAPSRWDTLKAWAWYRVTCKRCLALRGRKGKDD